MTALDIIFGVVGGILVIVVLIELVFMVWLIIDSIKNHF